MTKIITIDRQFGSAGKDVARLCADMLGFNYYDEEIVNEALKRSGISPDVAKSVDEKASSSLLYSIVTGDGLGIGSGLRGYNLPINDRFFIAESEAIKSFARQGDCVMLGRCADYVLENEPNAKLLSVFIYGAKNWRIGRVASELGLSEGKAKELVNRTDRQRRNFYEYYSGRDWGLTVNYDMCLNTQTLGIEKAAEIISEYFK
ncbi:MAG: cytidylate kinase-like family protein [Clostridiales bacterium]|nr:cytidylate kinase-like family protein [Clostridiales bacterium]